MKNSIAISIEFSFRGESYHPGATLDLDALMEKHGGLPELHRYLAQQNGIDTYSYLYDAMESYDIHFTDATGLAAEYLEGDRFDLTAFEERWRLEQEYSFLHELAARHLGSTSLADQPQLMVALREAYEAGKRKGWQSVP